jgi:hypothetical protein
MLIVLVDSKYRTLRENLSTNQYRFSGCNMLCVITEYRTLRENLMSVSDDLCCYLPWLCLFMEV